MNVKNKVSLVSVIAVLTVIGAGALQIGVALATIQDIGIRAVAVIAIGCAVVMDALVIHHMGTEPTNRKQFGVGLVIIGVLLVGLILDVVLLLTHDSFDNATFGFTRAFVGVNIAVSLVLAAAFFALSETNTHERQLKALEQKSEMQQANAFHNSGEAARLYRVKATTKFINRAANDLDVPVSEMLKVWNGNGPETIAPKTTMPPASAHTLTNTEAELLAAVLERTRAVPANGGAYQTTAPTLPPQNPKA